MGIFATAALDYIELNVIPTRHIIKHLRKPLLASGHPGAFVSPTERL